MTSDSISARPMIIARRIAPAAPGLRAMPSHAAEIARPWPIAPAAAATPRTSAAERAPHFTPPPATSSAANIDVAMQSTTTVIRTSFIFFTADSSLFDFENCTKRFSSTCVLVFFSYGAADVDHRHHDEDERLKRGAEDPESHHRPGNHE